MEITNSVLQAIYKIHNALCKIALSMEGVLYAFLPLLFVAEQRKEYYAWTFN